MSACEEPLKTASRATCSSQPYALLLSFLSDLPPAHGGRPIPTALRSACVFVCVCVCVCERVCVWVLGDSASLLRSTESEAAGAADADRLFSRQGQLGDRKGENERETIEGRKPQGLKPTQAETSERYRADEVIASFLVLAQ